jgi:pyruvate/2-oxoglutarate dehydrogenase complex dihydrolipoamide dehydrogenase (E3) component
MAIVKTRSNEFNIQFDAVLIATGRTPNIHHLDIEKAGIHVNSGKIVLNEQMQTSNKHVFVSGDATGKFFYSQAAELESSVIFRNLIFPVKKKINYQDLSWVTFTDPEVATFGLTEHELKKQKQSYDVLFTDFVNEDKAIIDDYQYGKLKIFTKTTLFGKKRILGGTMLAPEAGNMIQELLFAKYNNISFTSFFDKIYPYPVSSRIIKDVAIEDRIKTLKNWMKKIIRWLYSIN